jgi:hypothetical protein
MNDVLRHFLPPLRDGHRLPPVSTRGAWQTLAVADPLRVIGRGLNTDQQLRERAADIVSVPDVWAQVTVFHAALSGQDHPLHARASKEWRGLIACFALAAYRAPTLTCEVLPLAGRPASNWAEIVQRLPPRSPILDLATIDEIGLVSVDGNLIALAQPLTLLAPSRSLAEVTKNITIPWISGGRFLDPTEGQWLGRDEKQVLASFLDRLVTDLEAVDHRRDDRALLLGMAREFRREIGANLGAGAVLTHWPAMLGLPASPIFNSFRRLERAEIVGDTPSDSSLRLREEVAGSLRGIVLFDERLDSFLGKQANELRVWKSTTLQMVRSNPALLVSVRNEAQQDGYLVLTSDDFFLPSLYHVIGIEGEGGFTEHPAALSHHLLPLSPIALTIHGRADLARSLRMSGGNTGEATIDLTLPLASGTQTITISKRYGTPHSLQVLEPASALAAWPNLMTRSWNLHFAYSGFQPQFQFAVASMLTARGISSMLSTTDGYSAVHAASELRSGAGLRGAERLTLQETKDFTKYLFWLDGPIEATILEDRRDVIPRVAGLLLLPPPDAGVPVGGVADATIGIDFGTTNTAAYLRIGEGEPVALRIEPRHITAWTEKEDSRIEFDRELLPTNIVETPFQTILRLRPPRDAESGQVEKHPFRDALIYFAQKREGAVRLLRNAENDLKYNLKWSRDHHGRVNIELFLSQAVILCLVEAMSRGANPATITYRFSFPEAFRPAQKRSFQSAARSAVGMALRLVCGLDHPAPNVEFRTESITSALYFLHSINVPATEGLITLDIGGQTTDVSIMQARRGDPPSIAWRGSFELAGRHVLIDHLCRHPALLSLLAKRHTELHSLVRELGDPVPGAAAPSQNRVISVELVVNSVAFQQAIDRHLGGLADLREAEHLRAIALTAFAGMMDYVGRVLARLVDEGRITLHPASVFSVCVGGRASRLFRALIDGHEDQVEGVMSFLTKGTNGQLSRARLVFSDDPKAEVAYGLVCEDDWIPAANRVATDPILGEAMVAEGQVAASSQSLAGLDPVKPWRIEEPAEFHRFLGQLATLDIRPNLDGMTLSELKGMANNDLDRAMREAAQARANGSGTLDGDSMDIEPPFVLMLRRLVELLARDQRYLAFPQ